MAASRRESAESAAINSSLPRHHYLPALGVARADQPSIIPSSATSDAYVGTMSHVPTTKDSKHEDNSDHLGEGSLYSYISTRDISQFVREVHGRIFNTLSDTYLLPTDEAEWNRLDKQHSALLIAMGGLYPCHDLVEAVLAPRDGETKRVLDLGCGTGSWALQMALQYPHCEVRGVDIAPLPLDTAIFPPNLSFELDNVNNGLEHFFDQYDVVHARCLVVGLTDAEKTLKEIERCLKPGGLLVIVDGDKDMYDAHRRKIPMAKIEGDEDVSSVSNDGSWWQRKIWEAHEAAIMAGSNHETAAEVLDTCLWDHPLLDPDTVMSGGVYLPIGPWPRASDPVENQALKYSGLLMRQAFLSLHRGYHAILLRYGVTQATIDDWTARVDEELNSMKIRMWCRFRCCWARRRAGEGLPAPPLQSLAAPNAQSPAVTAHSSRPLYSFLEIYHTQEEAQAAWKRKRGDVGVWPTSAVKRASLT